SPTADTQTRTFADRYSILDPDSAIALGMSATLEIAMPGAQQIARVPLSAMFNQGGGPALWKVDADNRVQLLPVKIVRYEADSVLVTGVAEGDQIVLLGVHKLEAGRKVRLIGRPI
ncbi:MAG: efflux RND transporter periplasmic adaptor subunit, partial [Methylocystis sp.]